VEHYPLKEYLKFPAQRHQIYFLDDASELELGLLPLLEGTVLREVLDAHAIRFEVSGSNHLFIIRTLKLREAPLGRDEDLLPARELELGTTKSLNDVILIFVVGADRDDGLANVHAGNSTQRLTKSTSHSGLQSISTGTRQHFVDADDMVGVDSDTDMRLILTSVLGHVLIAANTASLKCLRGELFIFIRY